MAALRAIASSTLISTTVSSAPSSSRSPSTPCIISVEILVKANWTSRYHMGYLLLWLGIEGRKKLLYDFYWRGWLVACLKKEGTSVLDKAQSMIKTRKKENRSPRFLRVVLPLLRGTLYCRSVALASHLVWRYCLSLPFYIFLRIDGVRLDNLTTFLLPLLEEREPPPQRS